MQILNLGIDSVGDRQLVRVTDRGIVEAGGFSSGERRPKRVRLREVRTLMPAHNTTYTIIYIIACIYTP